LTTSKQLQDTAVQIKLFTERRVKALEAVGKRVIVKATSQLGTVKKAVVMGDHTIYHVQLDTLGSRIAIVMHQDEIVVIGEVQR
jgi:hypothetical protein